MYHQLEHLPVHTLRIGFRRHDFRIRRRRPLLELVRRHVNRQLRHERTELRAALSSICRRLCC